MFLICWNFHVFFPEAHKNILMCFDDFHVPKNFDPLENILEDFRVSIFQFISHENAKGSLGELKH